MSSEAKTSEPAAGSAPAAAAAASAASPAADAPLLADLDNDDTDSTFSAETDTTASISSSIQSYRTINGRRYHSDRFDTEYWGANDERQNEILDIMHHFMLLLLDGSLFKAPIDPEKLQKVVDIGTGTGIWAIDFADTYPNVSVIGTDISPIQPAWVPPNVEFQIDDCGKPWTFAENSLDFVHIRWMLGTLTDWEAVFRDAYRCLKPGGYIETIEPSAYLYCDDGTLPENSNMKRWTDMFIEASKKTGRPFTVVEDELQRKGLEAAGFTEIVVNKEKIPLGAWPSDKKYKEIGRYSQFGLEQDMEGVMMFVATLVGMTKEEITTFSSEYRKELRSGKQHGYYDARIVWGRKPLAA